MSLLDWVIIAAVAVLIIVAVRVWQKSGSCSCSSGSCCGNCSACRKQCGKNSKNRE